ncbi:MAG: FAD-dependent oxidoreductase [Bacteroidetes bacterium]|nr:FAD-dependent oxidoreductase [Bacteroidota bacterium]
MIPAWQNGVVERIEQTTYNTRRYWIRLQNSNAFSFKPGQFVTLDLPIHEQRNKRWRSYSIASAPDNSNLIELIIVLVENGAGSGYLFHEVSEGTNLTLRGPQGVFTLPDPIEKDLFFICTGTGIAPFRSMLLHILNQKIAHQNIHLIFGTRTQQDLLYADEMRQLMQQTENLFYHPTLSREHWAGHQGYVHSVYEALCTNRPPAQFLLCGWRNMIDEAKERILKMGYDKKDILLELYG